MLYILLSTYNGQNFLKEQLDSLLAQDFPTFRIIIRDDGSTDKTREILFDYSKAHKNKFDITLGHNIGAAASFMELLKTVPSDASYVCFCDQDDIWKNNKISRGVDFLKNIDIYSPAVYFSRMEVVDYKLSHLCFTEIPYKKFSLANALLENIPMGCTMVLNRAAINSLNNHLPNFDNIYMHDWWIYMAVSSIGKIIYDRDATILYRQHNNNVIGLSRGFNLFIHRIKRIINNSKKQKWLLGNELKRVYFAELTHDDQILLNSFLENAWNSNIFCRIKFAFANSLYRQKFFDNITSKLLIIFGLI